MRSTPSLRTFPNAAYETVPVFVRLTMALSRPFKDDLSTPPSSPPVFFEEEKNLTFIPKFTRYPFVSSVDQYGPRYSH